MTLTLMLSAPVLAVPVMMELMAVEQIDSEVTMVVEGNTVTVNGAEGLLFRSQGARWLSTRSTVLRSVSS